MYIGMNRNTPRFFVVFLIWGLIFGSILTWSVIEIHEPDYIKDEINEIQSDVITIHSGTRTTR
ncbi:MAG: hypothetical protein ACFFG0_36980, partial [Candidatus Thorarchaeota archaeon]